MQSIRIRFWRSMITAGGTLLGILFLSAVLITNPLEQAAKKEQAVQLGTMKKVYTATLKGHTVRFDGSRVQVDGAMVPVTRGAFKLTGSTMKTKEVINQGKMSYVTVVTAQPTAKEKREQEQGRARRIWLVIMSLLVCSVGIANAMLMSVTERFREIGTMKCLGALDKFVVELFLLEAMFMGIIASTLGAIGGCLVMGIIYWAKIGPAALGVLVSADAVKVVLQALLIGTGLTVFSTIMPALQAAKLPPAAALRSDV
jgi:hypothetical protein